MIGVIAIATKAPSILYLINEITNNTEVDSAELIEKLEEENKELI